MARSGADTRTGGRAATTGVIPGDAILSVGNPGTPTQPGWEWTLLTDVARLETGHTPSRRHPEYWGGAVPWIGIRDATGNHGRVLYETNEETNDLGIANSSARVLPAGTVCLSRTASVGYVVVMGRPMATSQDFVNWVCSERIDSHFLKYALLAERRAFLRFASGTTHQTIYFPEVKAFHICLPPIDEQRRIAHILGTLDDKIELNRRMNETLEEMARALFKSWFVDFDPVRAKAEGRDPGLPKHLAALFPGRLVDSELGEVPEGWLIRRLDDDFVLTMGQSPPGDTYNSEGDGLPFYQGRSDFGVRFPSLRMYCTAPTRLAAEGDTLVSVRAPVGDANLATEPCAIGRGVAAIRHKSGAIEFTIQQMRNLAPEFDSFNSEGTVFGSISKKDFHAIAFVAAPLDLVATFETIVAPVTACLYDTRDANRNLTSTRDLLLARLLAGKPTLTEVSAR